ncbi:MAG TPA: sulfite exporter TauE/SafE family protein [Solirubrobacteraceae bacterium]|nr:sulfite exporter TauE/SafE family protein [Solirubrobacteraceae bacterium]
MSWQWPAGAACGFLIALVTTPAGVSGAVLLLPVQLSVLRVPSPAVTPTNLIFNVVAVPGGLLRFWHERRLFNALSALLVVGTLPGVVVGAIVRVEYLSGGRVFMFIAAGVLMPLGLWLLLGSQRMAPSRSEPGRRGRGLICLLALAVGVVGGIYGIGGGSLLAPVLIASGFSAYEVAPATLLATFLTSIAGIATFEALQVTQGGSVAPEWILGVSMGLGGFFGSYAGARLQSRLPEAALRRLLGLIACLVAARYTQIAIEHGPSQTPAHAASS